MQKTLKFYRSKWAGGFLVALMAGLLFLSIILFIYKSYITGGFLVVFLLITIPRWKEEFNFKREIVIITEDAILVNTKKINQRFDLAEIKYSEFTSDKSIFSDVEYLLIHYHAVKDPEKIFLPDLNVSKEDLVWIINERAKNYFRLYKG